MKANELKELSTAEMIEKEKQFKDELFNLRFQLATGQLENTARLKDCLLYTSPSPRDRTRSRMPSSA